jgi:hypothetical protein
MSKEKSSIAPCASPRRRQCLVGAAGLWLGGPALALHYEGQDFDDGVQLGGSQLLLNGVGKRAEAIVRIYAAGLYLTAKAASAEAVLATPGPKRLQIRLLLDIAKKLPIGLNSVDADEFVKAIKIGVARNCSEAERAALTQRLPLLLQNLQAVGKVMKKDRINIDFLPEQGTLLTVNGRQWGQAIPGADLYNAFLKVFIGELPVDLRLKAGLLGQATQ